MKDFPGKTRALARRSRAALTAHGVWAAGMCCRVEQITTSWLQQQHLAAVASAATWCPFREITSRRNQTTKSGDLRNFYLLRWFQTLLCFSPLHIHPYPRGVGRRRRRGGGGVKLGSGAPSQTKQNQESVCGVYWSRVQGQTSSEKVEKEEEEEEVKVGSGSPTKDI